MYVSKMKPKRRRYHSNIKPIRGHNATPVIGVVMWAVEAVVVAAVAQIPLVGVPPPLNVFQHL